ncbi:MAG TPA: MotA/TolQ/ExbB proton channel family protein, partial [Chitinophagaceae bacterium]|nr:MotA/TolQ/ExbB proton channel family protein [Chitinophagaceae bacterium]
MIDLLQIVDTVSQTTGQLIGAKGSSYSFFDLITMGGWIMVPLGIMLLMTVYFFAERYIAIRHASRIDGNFMNIVRDHIVSGNVVAARSFAKNINNPVARIIDKE